MAELATIARPYAEALYEVARTQDLNQWAAQVDELAAVAANPQLRQFADHPKVTASQVFDLIVSVVKVPLADGVKNFLRTVIENDRLAALPAIAEQFHVLKNEASGVSDATIVSAFPIEPAQLADLVATLEKRFGRKLQAKVEVDPELIGGVRVVVGDEVLDTSVKARLERMKVALTA
ncbi:MAG: F0F1 ATP synthase subunit delta [Pseudomonadota bacterium]|uniref:ATP synthase subunit delta n=1 Tax=Caldimonas aquatica TaxID=376175 RepID=A0ABY6MRW6_9BURK|nr:F0F1 ATP synthase subunit delta [Schlegelella aquatica]UZD54744.1 F0F1 ATP synthase subunit delta [Schlegelella aquatica]